MPIWQIMENSYATSSEFATIRPYFSIKGREWKT